ncbi:hypothetical protein FGB62_110g08 [Gracilaria domingensis]|nr:hypothetical protein FGB62_110g08 [Gracilaria domingensis]
MVSFSLKPVLLAALVLTLAQSVSAWGPGECNKDGQTAARCCEHEAYWCHGGNQRALNHCHYCQEECIKIPSTNVCVWGGFWPARRKKCYNALEWFKVCVAIPGDASLGGGAFEHVDRQKTISPTKVLPSGSAFEKLPVKIAALADNTASAIVSAKSAGKLGEVVRPQRNPVQNQVAFVISLMGQVLASLRSVLVSNTLEAARNNAQRAVEALSQLITQARELIGLIPSGDRGAVRTIVDKWISAVRVIRATLQGFLQDDNTLAELKDSAQSIIDELAMGFWTRAQIALNAYAAFGRFTNDWAPWVNAIRDYFNNVNNP